jgi:hypothetical protein
MEWTIKKRDQLSKLYDINWGKMAKEAHKCSCTTNPHGSTMKCSNPKHMFYVKRERDLQKLSVKATEALSSHYKKQTTAEELLDKLRKESSK